MKRLLLLLSFCFIYLTGIAQNPVKVEDKIFNFGGKAGLTSAIPVVRSISIGGVGAENISYQYKVGISASVFGRINIDRFFLQPTLSWTRSSGEIRFQMPDDEVGTSMLNNDQLKYKIYSLEAPVLVGYKIVKEGPYGLSFVVGPNIKYTYKSRYTSYLSNYPREYESDNTPWGIGIVCGVGVSIWRLFFDVTYEFGLNKVDSDFKDYSTEEATEVDITIDKHTNMLSFSLGFLF